MAGIGQSKFPVPEILPNRTIEALLTTDSPNIAAGEVIGIPDSTSPLHFGVILHGYDHGDAGAVTVNSLMIVRKPTTTGSAILDGDYLTFGKVGTSNYFAASVSTTGQEIHAIAMEAASDSASSVLIWGPLFPPPFHTA